MRKISWRNMKLSAVRAWLHDQMCASENCEGDNDHAHRTQHMDARAIVDASNDEVRLRATHDALCIYANRGVECYDQGSHSPEYLKRLLIDVQKVIDNAIESPGFS